MSLNWSKLALVCGLCLSLQTGANAQAAVETFAVEAPKGISTRPLGEAAPEQAPQSSPQVVSTRPLSSLPSSSQSAPAAAADGAHVLSTATPLTRPARIALLLPLRSSTLGPAADALRAGFYAAYERERQGIEVTLVETGDAPQDVLAGYRNASAAHDIVVGPLSRSGATALARSNEVLRPTLSLTAPELPEGETQLPPMMLVMALSIEDEARQVADWARRDHATGTAYVIHTRTAWQRRAARAFATHWTRSGMAAKTIEIALVDGFLSAPSLLQLRSTLEQDPSAFVFAALDAGQARQLRESVGRQYPMYGTSQLNPVALQDRPNVEPVVEMEGALLLDIPWQLQADHPAVMVYPRAAADAEQRRNADLERLYALGIDAYRVARELAAQQTNFELDGVTGRLVVRFDRFGPHFERTVQQAVYRGGSVVPASLAR